MLLMWSAGAGTLTFRGPFTNTGNGYFASWICWILSAYLVYEEIPYLKEKVSEVLAAGLHFKTMLTIILGAVVVLIAAAVLCGDTNCKNQNGYAVAVPTIAIPVVIPFMIFTFLQPYRIWASLFMAVWWLIGAAVLTFDRPFTAAGNGYFGTWVACLGSLYWFYLCAYEDNFIEKGKAWLQPKQATGGATEEAKEEVKVDAEEGEVKADAEGNVDTNVEKNDDLGEVKVDVKNVE